MLRWAKIKGGVYRYHDRFIHAWIIQTAWNRWEFRTSCKGKTRAVGDTLKEAIKYAERILVDKLQTNLIHLGG